MAGEGAGGLPPSLVSFILPICLTLNRLRFSQDCSMEILVGSINLSLSFGSFEIIGLLSRFRREVSIDGTSVLHQKIKVTIEDRRDTLEAILQKVLRGSNMLFA